MHFVTVTEAGVFEGSELYDAGLITHFSENRLIKKRAALPIVSQYGQRGNDSDTQPSPHGQQVNGEHGPNLPGTDNNTSESEGVKYRTAPTDAESQNDHYGKAGQKGKGRQCYSQRDQMEYGTHVKLTLEDASIVSPQ